MSQRGMTTPLAKTRAGVRPALLPRVLLFVLVLAVFWFGGFLQFAESLPRESDHSDQSTDAIVVLTGGADRIKAGLALLSEQRATRMFVSGVDRGTGQKDLQDLLPEKRDVLTCCVDLGHEALDTRDNAKEAALWMHKRGYRSLRLVTSAYHMPRALLRFRHAMPDFRIVPHAVETTHVKLDEWWFWPGTAHLLASEFNKYALGLITVRVAGSRRPVHDE